MAVWTVRRVSGQSGMFRESLESFQTIWKVSDSLGTFQTVRNVSRYAEKFPDGLESFHTVWKLSGQFGKFADSLKSSRQSGKCPDSVESFQTLWKVSRSDLCFFWRIYVAKTIYALRPESFGA